MGLFSLTLEEINANPSILNGRSISGDEYDDLRLENVTLSHTTFNNIWSLHFYFKNVVFENCSFIDCEFHEGHMENVIFQGGVMSNSTRNRRAGYKVDWQRVHVNRVVLDGVSMQGAFLQGIGYGSIAFRNMSDFRGYRTGVILSGGNLQFRIDNCQLDAKAATEEDLDICLIGDPGAADGSTIYATNSKFINGAGLAGSLTKATYIDNCEFIDGAFLGFPKVMVVKNSILGIYSSLEPNPGDLYFVNNKFTHNYQSAVNSTNVYIIYDEIAMKSADDSQNATPIPVNVPGGGANIYNTDLQNPFLGHDIEYLNLRNVRILGGRWVNLNLKGGQWENVEIHEPIEIIGTAPQFGKDLKFYNLTFHPPAPTGPFNIPIRFSAKETQQPFEWPEVHVPTLEELGIDPD